MNRLRVFENEVVMRVFGSIRGEIRVGRRILTQ
jgi:hypothetical protein